MTWQAAVIESQGGINIKQTGHSVRLYVNFLSCDRFLS